MPVYLPLRVNKKRSRELTTPGASSTVVARAGESGVGDAPPGVKEEERWDE